jgi:four helix bundle protein
MSRIFDLEDRLIDFADMIIDLTEQLPTQSKAANHLGGQILRSGTAPALYYGEAQAAESNADFIHKTRIILKELRETNICNKLIQKRNFVKPDFIAKIIQENRELVAIFTASIRTATQNKGGK